MHLRRASILTNVSNRIKIVKNIAKSSKQRTADKNGTDVASHASPVALRTESLGMAASAIKLSESYICHIQAAIKLSITRTALFRSQSQSPFHSDRPWGGLSLANGIAVIDL